MRWLTISGSLRKASTNAAALEAFDRLAPRQVEVVAYRGLADLPAFNPDDDAEGAESPVPVAQLRRGRRCGGDRHRRARIRPRHPRRAEERPRLVSGQRSLRGQTRGADQRRAPRVSRAVGVARGFGDDGGASAAGSLRDRAADRADRHGGRDSRRRPIGGAAARGGRGALAGVTGVSEGLPFGRGSG